MAEIIYCRKSVYPAGMRFPRAHRCQKKVWKDGFCKIHHPDNVKVRREKSEARHREQYEQSPIFRLGRAVDRIRELEAAIDNLWPHIHDAGMRGESDFERAWLALEKVRKS
jgi:hypothetical protein